MQFIVIQNLGLLHQFLSNIRLEEKATHFNLHERQ